MKTLVYLESKILDNAIAPLLADLYGEHLAEIEKQKKRYLHLLSDFCTAFPEQLEADFFSTSGRTEIGGNHTDHNAGRVLAAAVSMDMVALASSSHDYMIEIHSQGYAPIKININDLNPLQAELFTSHALVRGVCAGFKKHGKKIGGFKASISGEVPKGSGLSSSAAFEVLIGSILNHLYNHNELHAVAIAGIAQYAENDFFGKPCGLMDQTTCAVGGIIAIDFKEFEKPLIKKVAVDFSKYGYRLVIVNTGGNHADLNDDYIALEHEMKSVAAALGKSVLRDTSATDLVAQYPKIRAITGDRAILRAIHFFEDDQRVADQVAALESGNINSFLKLITSSGESSWMYCQNCYTSKNPQEQGISIGLAMSKYILKGKGAYRVHGGGFAGTIQVFVPNELVADYISKMEETFGSHSCFSIQIRKQGAIKLEI